MKLYEQSKITDFEDSIMTLQSVLRDNSTKRKLLMTQDTKLKYLFKAENEIKQKLRSERKKAKILADFKMQRSLERQ